jgi:hypothetical protein
VADAACVGQAGEGADVIALRFTCGHAGSASPNAATAPVCGQCGETRIAHVKARAPRFTGTCTGPYAEYKALEPGGVDVTTAGPLRLKPQESEHG